MKKKLGFTLLALVCLTCSSFSTVSAETTQGSMNVTGSNLYIKTFPSTTAFTPLKVTGVDWAYSSASLSDLVIVDGRGTGEGWNLSVSASPITEVGGVGLTFPNDALTLYAPMGIYALENGSPSPTVSTGFRNIVNSPFSVAKANVGQGLGSYQLAFPTGALEINVPSTVKLVDKATYPSSATPYKTTLTWTLSNTP